MTCLDIEEVGRSTPGAEVQNCLLQESVAVAERTTAVTEEEYSKYANDISN